MPRGIPPSLLEALAFAERGAPASSWRAGRSRALAGGRVDPATLAEEARLAAAIREIDGRIAREQDKPFASEIRRRSSDRFSICKQADEAWRALVARMETGELPQYAALKYPRPCSIVEARACLADDEVALLFVLGTRRLISSSSPPGVDDATGGIAVHPLPPAATIAEAVGRDTSEVLEDPDATRERGAAAYRMLLTTASGTIAGKRLAIVPGGVLGQLPFELLAEPGGEGGSRFLVEGHAIRYAPSLTSARYDPPLGGRTSRDQSDALGRWATRSIRRTTHGCL